MMLDDARSGIEWYANDLLHRARESIECIRHELKRFVV